MFLHLLLKRLIYHSLFNHSTLLDLHSIANLACLFLTMMKVRWCKFTETVNSERFCIFSFWKCSDHSNVIYDQLPWGIIYSLYAVLAIWNVTLSVNLYNNPVTLSINLSVTLHWLSVHTGYSWDANNNFRRCIYIR